MAEMDMSQACDLADTADQ